MSQVYNAVASAFDIVVPKDEQGLQRAIVNIDGMLRVVYVNPTALNFPTQSDCTNQQVGTTSSAELATTSIADNSVAKEASNAIGAGDGEQCNSSAPSNVSSEEQTIKQLFDKQNLLRKEQEAAYQEFTMLKYSGGKRNPATMKMWKQSVDLGVEWSNVIDQLADLTSSQHINEFNALVRKWYPDNEKFKKKDLWECFKKCQDRYNENKSFYDRTMAQTKPENTSSTKAQDTTSSQGANQLAPVKDSSAVQPTTDADTSKPQLLKKGRWRDAVSSYSQA